MVLGASNLLIRPFDMVNLGQEGPYHSLFNLKPHLNPSASSTFLGFSLAEHFNFLLIN